MSHRKITAFEKKSCLGKRRFHGQDQVKEFIKSLRYNHKDSPGFEVKTLRAYRCNFCKGWHTTSLINEMNEAA